MMRCIMAALMVLPCAGIVAQHVDMLESTGLVDCGANRNVK